MRVRTALISVYDKRGLTEFGCGLTELGTNIYSTGKTHDLLASHVPVHEAGGYDRLPQVVQVAVAGWQHRVGADAPGAPPQRPSYHRLIRTISQVTGNDERLNGRLKTLYSTLYEAILTTERRPRQREHFSKNGLAMLDMVVNNFYPFETVAQTAGVTDEQLIENIDIGGPSMVRSAAKNYEHVLVVVDPDDYDEVLRRLRSDRNDNDPPYRRRMALKALRYVADYDRAIANCLGERWDSKKKRSPTG